MSVNWNWKQKMGEVTLKQTTVREDKEVVSEFKINMYKANCLFAMINEWKEQDEKTGETVDKYQFYTFFLDIDHLKRSVGLAGTKEWDSAQQKYVTVKRNLFNYPDDCWTLIRLNTFYKESTKIANVLTKAGFKVELYYEEQGK